MPQCQNCVKREYRCGYLDFPEERLNHLRMKNETRRQEEAFSKLQKNGDAKNSHQDNEPMDGGFAGQHLPPHGLHSHSLPPPLGPPMAPSTSLPPSRPQSQSHHIPPQDPTYNYPHKSLNFSSISSNSTLNSLNSNRSMGSVSSMGNEFLMNYPDHTPKENMKNVFISEFLSETRPDHDKVEFAYQNMYQIDPQEQEQYNQLQQLYLQYGNNQLQPQFDQSPSNHSSLTPVSASSQVPPPPPQLAHPPFSFPPTNHQSPMVHGHSDDGSGAFDLKHEPVIDLDLSFTSNQFINFENQNINLMTINELPRGNRKCTPLPNAEMNTSKFKKLDYKGFRAKQPRNAYYYAPVWNTALSRQVWLGMLTEGFQNKIYNSFLLDKALGLLICNLNILLTSDYLKNFHNTYYLNHNQPTEEDMFYNETLLHKFISKSYVYYGNLIKEIRESLNKYHVEYTIKISLFSAYSSYFLLNSSVNTLVTLNRSTASLLNKFIHETNDFNQLTSYVKYLTDLLHNHVNTCLIPDINFDIIEIVYDHFKNFKKFLIVSTSLYQSLQSSQLIRDFLPKHDCIEFEDFLNFLIHKFYPKAKSINSMCSKGSKDLRFVSYNMFFELINKWFKMLPAITNSMGSKIGVLQRVFYLFFIVTGKLLNQMFSPIRSILNIDCTNVLFPVIDFDYKMYKIDLKKDNLNQDQFTYLDKLSKNLLRLVTYCNNRTLLYGHYLSNDAVLEREYIRLVAPDQSDIVEILPQKLELGEKFLDVNKDLEFSLTFENFPKFPEFADYPPEFFEVNTNNEYDDGEDFDYDVGLYKTDFNPAKLIDRFLNNQKISWELNPVRLHTVKLRTKNYHQSRRVISKSIQNKTTFDD